jgi:CII-binding regulator of phage lambda lysogenization HflD
MSQQLVRTKTPEEEELEKKRVLLRQLESQLADREVELATLQAELAAFERRYLRIVGLRYAQLDKLEAQIAAFFARQNPDDHQAQERATHANARAQVSSDATEGAESFEHSDPFVAADSPKKLYRDIARRLHPDMTVDPEEKKRRHTIMADATNAYERGDEARLREILSDCESSPESVKGEGAGADLVRVIRSIAQVKRRLEAISAQLNRIADSDLHTLKKQVDHAAKQGRDLLAEMAESLDRQIRDATDRLSALAADRQDP